MRLTNETSLSAFETNKNGEPCTKIGEFAQKSRILETLSYLWHKTAVPIYIERFLLTILAAFVVGGLVLANPMGLDNTQRFILVVMVILVAYFLAHTLYKHNQSKDNSQTATNASPQQQQSQSSIELKKQAQQISTEMLQFLSDRNANEPKYTFKFDEKMMHKKNGGLTLNRNSAAFKRETEAMERANEESARYSDKTKNDFIERFGVRYETIIRDLESRGAKLTPIDKINSAQTNPITMRMAAVRVGVLANELQDTLELKPPEK